MSRKLKRVYGISDQDRLRAICGPGHSLLQRLEMRLEDYDLRADSQGGGVGLSASTETGLMVAELALSLFEKRLDAGFSANSTELDAAINAALAPVTEDPAALTGLRRNVSAQTAGQSAYLAALTDPGAGLIFGVGPAGTGKTYLAVAVGASELATGKRERLIVARPAVEAGEKLGFLPGDLEDKVDPYMLPIWDALREFFGQENMERRRARGEIEVAPLAFMRGRTLKNAFVVIDEAQNATIPQMKMVLTRLGRGSRMVVTGDPTQVDLPAAQGSGLGHALNILEGVNGIRQMRLTRDDVVRHDLVSRIIDAYDADERSK